MTNNIAAATAQVALNKIAINTLHLSITSYRGWRIHAKSMGDDVYVTLLTAAIEKTTKKIARYVVVQKAAKKYLAEMIIEVRCQSLFNLKQAIEDGRQYKDVVKNLSSGWMDSCGKGSV